MPQFTFSYNLNNNLFNGFSAYNMTIAPQMNNGLSSIFNAFNNIQWTGNYSYNPSAPLFNFNSIALSGVKSAPQTAENAPHNMGQFGTNVRKSTKPVVLTSDKLSNALNLAESQVGVSEVAGSNNGKEVNKYRNGKADGTPWCASFISWCFGQGQKASNNKTFGYETNTQNIRRKAEKAGCYAKKEDNYQPKVGDLAMWKYSSCTGHIGIISKVNNDGSFEVIEGNCADQVRKVTRTRSAEGFHGFVKMNEWMNV